MKLIIPSKIIGVFTVLGLILSSCVTNVAPAYDSEIVKGINELNRTSYTYFESISGDLASKKYADYEKTYNEIIGTLQSLIKQSDLRPVPENKAVKKLNSILKKKGQPIWDPKNNLPSTVALQGILNDFQQLKTMHYDGTINPGKLALRKNSVIVFLEQAIVFEYALDR